LLLLLLCARWRQVVRRLRLRSLALSGLLLRHASPAAW
jgi:hypothetical protein